MHVRTPEERYLSQFQERSDPQISSSAHPFTIYPDNASTSTGSSEVTLQGSFSGRLCIPSSLADQPCRSLDLDSLLYQLNDIMGTTYPLTEPIAIHLQECITRNDDFGTAYARLRPHWYSDFATLQIKIEEAEANDKRARSEALNETKDQIINVEIPPRRVWDLYSNRVIPRWWAAPPHEPQKKGKLVVPVSHAWVEIGARVDISTSINSHLWPVPVPSDSSLERVRIELLNLDLEYVWLDVLCLRQRGDPENEEIRLEEWTLDVPTIGHVYRQDPWDDRVVVYFNGLGRPFRIQNLDGERHWLNRAWTVQEAGHDMIIGGQTPTSPTAVEQRNSNRDYQRFYQRMDIAK
ncbi:hypothetical protein D9615_003214 [Tricholomella constricta]|uniref:Heterokaryon incompatibility domain-containing protein n=1 Tax=Tricholomella constricta TaxID=117010 RepID=A0A8H5HJD9_9AGAR|nr:hypothetical protein D9615_003214 [Tricholomella constricta]